MTGIIGIILAHALLMYLAYRGISVLILAPAMALLAVLFEGVTPILGSYFMSALGNFIALYFPLFLLGILFGKLMEDSGSAQAIAQWIVNRLGKQHSILAVVLSCPVLTYGGVVAVRDRIRGLSDRRRPVSGGGYPQVALIVLIMLGSTVGAF